MSLINLGCESIIKKYYKEALKTLNVRNFVSESITIVCFE